MLTPNVRLFLVCAHGEIKASNNTVTLVDPIFEFRLPANAKFPLIVRSLHAYANLSGGLGLFRIQLEISDEQGRLVTKAKPFPVQHTAENRREGSEFLFEIPDFKVKAPGVFTVGLFQNYKCIATTDVCILSTGE